MDNLSGFKLGRRAPKRTPSLRLGSYLTGTVPVHPDAADHFGQISDWGLYGNDRYGDCGPVSVANQRKLVTRYLTGTEVSVSQDDVFDLYKRSGNPAFPTEDNGVDMQTMLEALVTGGIGGTMALGFASVDVKNQDQLDAAIAIFGSLLFGVTLETAQQSQGTLWDYQQSGIWGGHAVLAGRYAVPAANGADTGIVTWGRTVDATDAFLSNQLEEAWVVIWPEHLNSGVFMEGIDFAALAADYKALTGNYFPGALSAPPPVAPAPAPAPSTGRPGCLSRIFGRR